MSKQKLTNKNLTTILIIPLRDIYYNSNDNKNNIKKQPIKNNNSNDDYNRCINKKYNIMKIPKSVHENKIISILVYLHNKLTKDNKERKTVSTGIKKLQPNQTKNNKK